MKPRRCIVVFVVAISVALPVVAQEEYQLPFVYSTVRSLALGGYHAADAHGLSSIFSNPAGFQKAEPTIGIAQLSATVGGPLQDLVNIAETGLGGGEDALEGLIGAVDTFKLLTNMDASATLMGPLHGGYVGNGFGFGLFSDISADLRSRDPFKVGLSFIMNASLSGGYAYRIPIPEMYGHTLDIGAQVRGSVRGTYRMTNTLRDLFVVDTFGVSLLDRPLEFMYSVGLDVGILYSFRDIVSVGITSRDVYSYTSIQEYSTVHNFVDNFTSPESTTKGSIPTDLSVGVAVTPPLGRVGKVLTDLTLYVDYRDILDLIVYEQEIFNPLSKLSAGLNISLIEIFHLMTGINNGYLSAGLAVDLSIFTIEIAMYGSKSQIGQKGKSITNVVFGFGFQY